MVKYILKKIVYMIVTLWIILTATFFLMYTMPGDPTQASSKVLPEAVQENLKAKWGLDKPVTEQYVIYLKNLFQGNMGESYTTPGPVSYTHLDVYKRQGCDSQFGRAFLPGPGRNRSTAAPG